MVEQKRAQTGKFFASAGPSRPPMQTTGNHVPVAGVLAAYGGIHGNNSAVQITDAENDFLKKARIVRKNRGNQRSVSPARHRDYILGVIVGHESHDGTEHLDVVNILCGEPVVAGEKRGLNERGLLWIGINWFETFVAAKDDQTFRLQFLEPFETSRLLRFVDHGPHFYFGISRIPYFHRTKARGDGFTEGFDVLPWQEDAPDGGAFLTGLESYFFEDFFHQKIEQFCARSAIRAENGGVDAVGFNVHANGAAHDIGMRTNACGRVGGTGEGNNIFFTNVLEQLAGRAANERNGTWRQDARLDDIFHHFVCQPSCGGGRLHKDGNTREKCRRHFFAETPGGKIEGVNENGHAFCGHEKMLAGEDARLRKRNNRTFLQHFPFGEGAANLCVILYCVERAVNIERSIGLRGTKI